MSSLRALSQEALDLFAGVFPGVVYELHWRADLAASSGWQQVLRDAAWPAQGAFVPVRMAGRVKALLGEEEAQILGDADWWWRRLHPADRERVLATLPRLFRTGRLTMRYRLLRADGRVLHLQDTMRLFSQGSSARVVGVWVDVSDQETDRELLAHAFELSPDAIAVLTLEGGYLLVVNRAFEAMVGVPRRQMLGQMLDRFVEFPSPGVRRRVLAKLRRDGKVHGARIRVHTPRGELIEGELHASRVEIMGEACALVELRDITERLAYEQRLREHEERWRTLLETMPDALLVHDGARILFANRMAEQWFGDALRGKAVLGFVLKEDRALAEQHLVKLGQGEHGVPVRTALRMVRRDGSWFWVEGCTLPLVYEGKSAFLCVLRDISERREMEKRLREMQKMEATATLAGGIAHDFNNLLAAILGNLYLLRKATRDPRAIERIERIEDSARRASEMIQQLLTFARRMPPKRHRLGLRAFLKELYKLARAMVPESIAFEFRCALEEEAFALADPAQIQQAVLNLIKNAQDAVEEGAGSRIALVLDAQPPPVELVPETTARRWLHIAVEDDGIGISPEVRDRAFEPFFTTKGPDRGTGLGLAVVQGIAAQHEGACALMPRNDRGAVAHLWLPEIVEDPRAKGAPDLRAETTPVGRGEGVLLVDDDELLREAYAEVLRMLGYEVFVAADAEEAEEIFARMGDRIQALITDLVMPGKSGVQLAEELRKRVPRLAIILQTGYGPELAAEAARMPGAVLLQKPTAIEELARHLRSALEAQAQAR